MRISTALPAQQASTEGPQRYLSLIPPDPQSPRPSTAGAETVVGLGLTHSGPTQASQLVPHRAFRSANGHKAT